jgi:fucose 4-O-acetylase-like acetyltransferase
MPATNENLRPQPHGRIGWVDTIKVFAIFTVFLGHKTDCAALETIIYSFHIPLFFWVSGYVFNLKKHPDFRSFLRRRFRTLMVPYFVFAALSFAFWLVVVHSLSVRGNVFSIDPWPPFAGIFYGVGSGPWHPPMDVALWFLPCLFITDIYFWFINRHLDNPKTRIAALCLFCIAGLLWSRAMPFRLPWSADVALCAVIFYTAGYYTGRNDSFLSRVAFPWKATAIALLGALNILLALANGKADMNYNFYGNALLFFGAAFSGIYFWYLVIRGTRNFRFISYLGGNTIILIGMVGISSFVLRGLSYVLFDNLLVEEKFGIVDSLFYSVLEIALIVPVIYAINRFAPFILGRDPSAASFLQGKKQSHDRPL